ncbi:hypothetical protein FNU79_12400 [Deinococcus detaillensis]|uniref:TIGR04222 domain-containing membrane protein n=1 Tax=Deinococcus detaillensis TaxID=2592048 RepID=A0A553USC8_9DEIO|nr:hypothetical protein [Deinococcus detaillensis]TSA83128.1 hypothetical protein FNU79_12400 [Deinococcus detaillensis]
MTAFSLPTQDQIHSIPSAHTLKGNLLSYEFPSGFAERLAHEHSWTLPFTLEVLREYRRFLVLAATCGQSVTPSKAVDAAWHEHLTHTRDYWLRLIPLLPAPLHHDPSGGSTTESAHFAQQYLGTLELYHAEFGQPDAQIWPNPRLPISLSPTPRPIKRRLSRWLLLAAVWLLGGLALYQFGIWAVAGLALLGVVVAAQLSSPRKRRGGSGGDGNGGSGFFGLLGDLGSSNNSTGDSSCGDNSGDSGNCDSGGDAGGSSDGGGSCGSGCGGGCSS